jgi:hypothetical protein
MKFLTNLDSTATDPEYYTHHRCFSHTTISEHYDFSTRDHQHPSAYPFSKQHNHW